MGQDFPGQRLCTLLHLLTASLCQADWGWKKVTPGHALSLLDPAGQGSNSCIWEEKAERQPEHSFCSKQHRLTQQWAQPALGWRNILHLCNGWRLRPGLHGSRM